MSILLSWLSPLRAICMAIDGIAFSLLDNAYNIVIELSKAEFMDSGTIADITKSLYIVFGVVAFFRLAMVLINSMIDPEKFSEKGKGVSNIFFRIVGMIIILFITPWLFEQAYKIQRTVVGADTNQNIIFQLFLGDNANIGGHDENGYNAGKALQNIVLSSLITVDDQYLVNDGATCSYNDNGQVVDSNNNVVSDVNSTCGFIPLTCVANSDGKTCTNQGGYIYDPDTCDWGNCQKAVSVYNEMYVNEDMSPNKLSKWVGTSTDLEDENGEETEVYVYDYMFIVTGVAGIFMTYVIISFAIDIAVRIFELVVLQVLSPLFIATFVDPKSTQSGPFKNWLSALGKSYANLFIKLAILALMTFFIMYLNKSEMFKSMGDVSGWAKLFVIIGLLIFAKKAPKWISDILGIKSDGMGLWSPSKLRENMVGGALAARAARTGLGLGMGAVKNAHAARKANRINRANEGKTIRSRAHNAAAEQTGLGNKAKAYLGSMFTRKGAAENAKNLVEGKKNNIIGGASAMLSGAVSGLQVGFKSSDLKDLNTKTGENAKNLREKYAPGHKSVLSRAGQKLTEVGDSGLDKALGDEKVQQARKKALDDKIKFEASIKKGKNLEVGDLPLGEKGFINTFKGSKLPESDAYAAASVMNEMRGSNPNIDNFKVTCDGKNIEIKGIDKDNNVVKSTTIVSDKDNEQYKKYVSDGKGLVTLRGEAQIADNAVALQQASVTNVQQATQFINQIAQANNAAQQSYEYNATHFKNLKDEISSVEKTLKDSLKKLGTSLGQLNLSVGDIDNSSIKDLKESYKKALDEGLLTQISKVDDYYNKEDEYDSELKNVQYAMNSATTVINNNNAQISSYKDFINSWKPTYDSITGGNTYEEKTAILEKARKDSSELLKSFEKPSDKKDES